MPFIECFLAGSSHGAVVLHTTCYAGRLKTATLGGTQQNRKTYWYTYATANRVAIANGRLSAGQVVLGSLEESYEQRYDAAGNVIVKRYRDDAGVIQYDKAAYDAQGHLTTTFWYDSVSQTTGLREKRRYDAAGRLTGFAAGSPPSISLMFFSHKRHFQ